ncbi:adenylyl-sulfate kinase [Phytohabitans sp. LJ34]|uniref:adenylyl-sulfate kinase n=1 Tax=Phytohabitans sp. LJ34 TaxID=3452217 RepID=UPI003F88EE5E
MISVEPSRTATDTGGQKWHASMGPRASVIWITGLSGAGKTTVARELVRRLHAGGCRPILLDGDDLRYVLGVTGAFDLASRRQRAFVYARLCESLANQGHIVVCATIAMFHDVHSWNRAHLPGYVEVLLDVPMPELHRRDPKGIYGAGGANGEIVGAALPAEFPNAPHLVIANHPPETPTSAADRIHRAWTQVVRATHPPTSTSTDTAT